MDKKERWREMPGVEPKFITSMLQAYVNRPIGS